MADFNFALMGPRKKVKPNPKAEVLPSQSARQPSAAAIPLPADREPRAELKEANGTGRQNECPVASAAPTSAKGTDAKSIGPGINGANTAAEKDTSQATKSWYGGTWPRMPKAAPVTQIARESISAATEVASEVVASARKRTLPEPSTSLRSPSLYLSQSIASSTRSLPLSATITKVNASSSALGLSPSGSTIKPPDPGREASKAFDGNVQNSSLKATNDSIKSSGQTIHETMDLTAVTLTADDQNTSQGLSAEHASTWLGWFSRGEPARSRQPNSPARVQEPSKSNKATQAESTQSILKDAEIAEKRPQSPRRNSDPNPVTAAAQQDQQRRSWFGGFWSNPVPLPEAGKAPERLQSVSKTTSGGSAAIDPHSASPSNILKTVPKDLGRETPENGSVAQSSGWAFWSRNSQETGTDVGTLESTVGQLAIAGSPSQSKPENATVDRTKGLPKAADRTGKCLRPSKLAAQGSALRSDSITTVKPINGVAVAASFPATARVPKATSLQSLHPQNSNLLLPAFKETYHLPESPGFFQQLGHYLNYGKPHVPKHVSLVQDPPRIKKALAIGVHGYFPAPLIRSVLGQPTGTSIKFAESAANAIQQWTKERGYSCGVEKIALEGEGKIEERVELLWILMLNWLEDIRKADFILVACHSQGVPVAMMLISKLIAFGCINGARIGVCAMAGVNMGPFASYQSRWISGSAGELFDFAQPDSKVSKDYKAALSTALSFGVRVVYVGSIDDQLVSLEACLPKVGRC